MLLKEYKMEKKIMKTIQMPLRPNELDSSYVFAVVVDCRTSNKIELQIKKKCWQWDMVENYLGQGIDKIFQLKKSIF